MSTRDGAESACANPNPIVDGRKANVNLAYLGAKPKNHSQPCELLAAVYFNILYIHACSLLYIIIIS